MTLGRRGKKQKIAIVRISAQQGFGGGQSLRMTVVSLQRPYPGDLALDVRGRCGGNGRGHGPSREERAARGEVRPEPSQAGRPLSS